MDARFIYRREGIIVVDRGPWVSGEDYEVGDLSQNSGSFICIAPHTSGPTTEPNVGAIWATVWKPLQVVTGTYQSLYFKAQDTAPYYRLIDGSGADALIRLSAGVLQFWDNIRGVIMAGFNMATGLLIATSLTVSGNCAVTGVLTAAPKTDHQMQVNHVGGYALSGTWTPTLVSNVPTLTRTASTTDGLYLVEIKLPKRTTANKGAKLKSITISYVMGGTIDTANDTLFFYILKNTLPTNGSAAAGAILAGDADGDYDAAHDTKAERLASGNHTCVVTIPAGEQAYAADLETYWLEVYVDDASTANLAFAITGMVANYESAEY